MTATYDEVLLSLGLEPSGRGAECGTPSGRNRHRRLGETPCAACLEAVAAYRRERRAAPKRVDRLQPIDHGTANGARRHWYRNEPPCDACRDAYNSAQRPGKRAWSRQHRAALAAA